MKKATFIGRLLAYLLDGIIVLLISSIVASGFASRKVEDLQNELESAITNYTTGEITIEKYLEQTQTLTYEIEKNSIAVNVVYVVISIGYFVVFQFLNKGQTIGKKIMKIRIVNEKEENPNIGQIITRTLIVNQILPNILVIIFVVLLSKNQFLSVYSAITTITYIFIIVSSLMILYRNDKLGLHDLLSKTKVVKEGK